MQTNLRCKRSAFSLAAAGCLAAAAGIIGTLLSAYTPAAHAASYQTLVANAQADGEVYSLAMPDEWANWAETWRDIKVFYGINHRDTDMNSVQELEEFERGVGDIGDVGFAHGSHAASRGLTMPYKTSYWDDIPEWAKDREGHWMVTYLGTIAFLTKDSGETKGVSEDGLSMLGWADLKNSKLTVGTSDVRTSSQAQYTVYAAACALGGGADNIQPGIDLFVKLAKEGRLTDRLPDQQTSIASNVDVNVKWDFLALGYRDAAKEIDKSYTVCIPNDGSVTVGYVSIINAKAKHPSAAKLAREYILSDAGQANLARGYATPIRTVRLSDGLLQKRVPREQYTEYMIRAGVRFNSVIAQKIADAWTREVLPVLESSGRCK